MKKKLIALFIMIVMVLASVVGLVACDPDNPDNPDNPNPNNPGSKTTITIWVSETEGVKTMTETQIAAFMDANPSYKDLYTIKIEGVSESKSATDMITDVASGADIYCFAQDQLTRLVQAGALAKPGPGAVTTIKANNDGGSVKAASAGEDVYAYPLTSDNGYFMYYDKSAMEGVDMDDLAAIVKKCEDTNRLFSMKVIGSVWYGASFFFGAGCTSQWVETADAKDFESVNDDFDSAKGKIAALGMSQLVTSSAFNDSESVADFTGKLIPAVKDDKGNVIQEETRDTTNTAAVVISGTWDAKAAREALGDNLGVAKLPSYTVNGSKYQMGSYSGNKLMGVKPHTKAEDAAFCQALALYLTNKDCQLARFNEFGWGPSNKEAQQDDAVKSDPILAAFAAQSQFATPQGNIHGSWWDIGSALAQQIKDANNDEDKIDAALATYKKSIDDLFNRTDEEKLAWGVIGQFNSWNADAPMTKSDGEAGATVYTSEAIELVEGDGFKIRQGAGWDVQYGAGDVATLEANTPVTARAKDATGEGGNFTVAVTGTYKVVLTIAAGGASATVEIVPVEAE